MQHREINRRVALASVQPGAIEAMEEFNNKLHRLLSGLREGGHFAGELGETLVFTPPPDSITPKKVLLIGVGNEPGLTPERLRFVGVIAARESIRLKVVSVSFAPGLRDQGSSRIDAGDGAAAFAQGWISGCDTEKRLQEERVSPVVDTPALTIEAGPKYFEAVYAKVAIAVEGAVQAIHDRTPAPLMSK
ncbi:MAG TPA: M17 family peptidase N-terminal domain-containing protein [Tepidisphaeraceae bacterium]|nr:M17 family peptidase N-terminal domain-containing protein [Tepidisphaeraceae bacterium]